jgi:hypothetical protein
MNRSSIDSKNALVELRMILQSRISPGPRNRRMRNVLGSEGSSPGRCSTVSHVRDTFSRLAACCKLSLRHLDLQRALPYRTARRRCRSRGGLNSTELVIWPIRGSSQRRAASQPLSCIEADEENSGFMVHEPRHDRNRRGLSAAAWPIERA